jgi:uncharacterized SAM-binding protein YcdF (DUF218 family)
MGTSLVLLRDPLLRAAGGFLTINDPIRSADLIFVLGGDLDARPFLAARLYHAGYAPRIAIPWVQVVPSEELGIRPNQALDIVALLRRLRVPDSAMVLLRIPGGSTSTLDDARILAGYMRKHHFRSALAVTNDFHTRRTRWVIRHEPALDSVDVRVRGIADPRFDETNWWRHESGILLFAEEYLKWIHNSTQR